MKPEEQKLPDLVAPPLAPDASFDADVAAAFDVEWLDAPHRPNGLTPAR